MYPFKTDEFSFKSKISQQEFKSYLERNIHVDKIFKIKYSNYFYGRVENNFASFELGHVPNKNAFRPIVKISWKTITDGNEIEIKGYYKLDNSVLLLFGAIPLIGLFSFPLIGILFLTVLIFFIIFVIIQPIYNNSKKQLTKDLDNFFLRIKYFE